MANEFEIIRTYLKGVGPVRKDVAIGIGDDAAVVDVNDQTSLAMALDVLVEGVHFPAGTSADRIAHKALAVNLSDLAAMGATPAWFTLGLTLPNADDDWMAMFSGALSRLADEHAICLIGGDTTRGPLSICIHVCGTIAPGMAIERSGANMGDCVFITGDIGGAALGLGSYNGQMTFEADQQDVVRDCLDWPVPRVALGQRLVGLASAAIDVSDGLAQDLGHLLDASGLGATVWLDRLPLHPVYAERLDDIGYEMAIGFGDDYELLFTAPQHAVSSIRQAAADCNTDVTMVGVIELNTGLRLMDASGEAWVGSRAGHEHFRDPD